MTPSTLLKSWPLGLGPHFEATMDRLSPTWRRWDWRLRDFLTAEGCDYPSADPLVPHQENRAHFLADGRWTSAAPLRTHPILGASSLAIERIYEGLDADPPSFAAGEVIIGPRAPRAGIGMMRHGRARVTAPDALGRQRVYAQLRYGTWVGLPMLLRTWAETEHPSHASAVRWPRYRVSALPSPMPGTVVPPADQHHPDNERNRIVVDWLDQERALELMRESPAFRDWVINNVALRFQRWPSLNRWMDTHPMLRVLELEDRQYLLQCGALRRVPHSDRPYMAGDRRHNRVSMVLDGEVRFYERDGEGFRFVGHAGDGALVGHEDLYSAADVGADLNDRAFLGRDERKRSTSVFLSADAEVVEFGWRAVRWTLADRPDTWSLITDYLSRPGDVSQSSGATLVLFGGARQGLGTSTLALGGALALARSLRSRSEGPAATGVWIIDADPHPGRLSRRLSGSSPPPERAALMRHLAEDLRQSREVEGDYRFECARAADGVDVAWILAGEASEDGCYRAGDLAALEYLIQWLRFLAETRYVLVDLPAPSPGGSLLAHNLRQRLNTPETRFVWVNDQPELLDSRATTSPGMVGLPEQLPLSLIRVDRMTPAFRQALAEQYTPGEEHVEYLSPIGDKMTSPPWRHWARVPDDADSAGLVQRGDYQAVLGPEQAMLSLSAMRPLGRDFARLARMIQDRTVGLALGGGGAWGVGHVALLEQLEGAGVPIDYIAGTSAGAVWGGLYAGGGLEAVHNALLANPRLPPVIRDIPGLRDLYGALSSELFRGSALLSFAYSWPVAGMIERAIQDAPSGWSTPRCGRCAAACAGSARRTPPCWAARPSPSSPAARTSPARWWPCPAAAPWAGGCGSPAGCPR